MASACCLLLVARCLLFVGSFQLATSNMQPSSGYTINLFQRRNSRLHFFQAIHAQRVHAGVSRELANLVQGAAVADLFKDGVVGEEQLVDADAPAVAEIPAARAALGAEQLLGAAGDLLELALLVERRFVFLAT